MEARKARDLGRGTGESFLCPGMPGRRLWRQLRPTYVWNVKSWESQRVSGGKAGWESPLAPQDSFLPTPCLPSLPFHWAGN